MVSFNTASGKYCCNVLEYLEKSKNLYRFNTASGKYCCNNMQNNLDKVAREVSIPQAVSTVATYI